MKEHQVKNTKLQKEKKGCQTEGDNKQNNPFLSGSIASSNPFLPEGKPINTNPFFDTSQLKVNPFAVGNQGNPFDIETIQQEKVPSTSKPVMQGVFKHTKDSVKKEGFAAGINVGMFGLAKTSFGNILESLAKYEKVVASAFNVDFKTIAYDDTESFAKAGISTKKKLGAIKSIIYYCDEWLFSPVREATLRSKAKKNADDEKAKKVEEIKKDAQHELYDLEDEDYVNETSSGEYKSTKGVMGNELKFQEAKNKNDAGYLGENIEIAKKEVKDAGLTKGEMLGLSLFTGDDYKYIKPAYEDNDSWLEEGLDEMRKFDTGETQTVSGPAKMYGQQPTIPVKSQGSKKKKITKTYKKEGKKHAEMAIRALDKLPPYKGKVYRGMGVTQEDFDKNYQLGKVIKYTNLTSTSAEEGTPITFMLKNKDKGVMMIMEIEGKSGKYIDNLSTIKGEKEVLYAPGASFKINRIRKQKSGNNFYYRVYMKEN
jgi:hypothetical protein